MPGSSAQARPCCLPATPPTVASSSSSPNVGSGLVGVYDPSAAPEAHATRAAVGSAFEPWERASVVSTGPLTAARSPAEPGIDGGERFLCLLAGRIHNLDRVARELGCGPDLPAERVLAAGYAKRGEELLAMLRG